MPREPKLDPVTLRALLREAKVNYDESQAAFEENDGVEDMHAAEHWESTVAWLNHKLKKP